MIVTAIGTSPSLLERWGRFKERDGECLLVLDQVPTGSKRFCLEFYTRCLTVTSPKNESVVFFFVSGYLRSLLRSVCECNDDQHLTKSVLTVGRI